MRVTVHSQSTTGQQREQLTVHDYCEFKQYLRVYHETLFLSSVYGIVSATNGCKFVFTGT